MNRKAEITEVDKACRASYPDLILALKERERDSERERERQRERERGEHGMYLWWSLCTAGEVYVRYIFAHAR